MYFGGDWVFGPQRVKSKKLQLQFRGESLGSWEWVTLYEACESSKWRRTRETNIFVPPNVTAGRSNMILNTPQNTKWSEQQSWAMPGEGCYSAWDFTWSKNEQVPTTTWKTHQFRAAFSVGCREAAAREVGRVPKCYAFQQSSIWVFCTIMKIVERAVSLRESNPVSYYLIWCLGRELPSLLQFARNPLQYFSV